jgi:hypothetical protein
MSARGIPHEVRTTVIKRAMVEFAKSSGTCCDYKAIGREVKLSDTTVCAILRGAEKSGVDLGRRCTHSGGGGCNGTPAFPGVLAVTRCAEHHASKLNGGPRRRRARARPKRGFDWSEPAPQVTVEPTSIIEPSKEAASVVGTELIYDGKPVHVDGERMNLTEAWKAAGSDPNRTPYEWSRTKAAERLISHLEADTGNTRNELLTGNRGGSGSGGAGATWGDWRVALAYAEYLSPKFHVWALGVVRSHMKGELRPVASVSGSDMILAFERMADKIVAPLTSIVTSLANRVDKLDATLAKGPTVGDQLKPGEAARVDGGAVVREVPADHWTQKQCAASVGLPEAGEGANLYGELARKFGVHGSCIGVENHGPLGFFSDVLSGAKVVNQHWHYSPLARERLDLPARRIALAYREALSHAGATQGYAARSAKVVLMAMSTQSNTGT